MKLYSLEELKNRQFDDKEIDALTGIVFVKSCILAMFRYVKSTYSDKDIFDFIKQDGWMNRKYWSWNEHDTFTKELARAYKNLYRYTNENALRVAQDFVYKYGFAIKDSITNENKHYKRLFDTNL